jgi:hypothetical protein
MRDEENTKKGHGPLRQACRMLEVTPLLEPKNKNP